MECEKSGAAAEIDFEARSKGGEYSQSLILELGEKVRRAHGFKICAR